MDDKQLTAKTTVDGCKKTYSREFLLRFRACDAARLRPIGLSYYPHYLDKSNLEEHVKKNEEEPTLKKKRKGKKEKKLEIQQQGSAGESVTYIDNIARQETTAQSEDCQTIYKRKAAKSQSNEADKSSIREETISTTATFKTTIAKLLDDQIKRHIDTRLQQRGHLDNEATYLTKDHISADVKMSEKTLEEQGDTKTIKSVKCAISPGNKTAHANELRNEEISYLEKKGYFASTKSDDLESNILEARDNECAKSTDLNQTCLNDEQRKLRSEMRNKAEYDTPLKKALSKPSFEISDLTKIKFEKQKKNSKLSRAHQLLVNGEMPTEKEISSMPNAGICAKHNGELLRFYCKKHQEFGCSMCVVIYHKRCQVELIEEISTGFDESEEYKKVVTKLRGSVLLLTEQVKLSSQNENIVKNSEDDLISKIRNFRSSVDVRFDAMERAAITKVREVCQKEIEILRNVSDTCVEKVREINEIDDNLKSLEEFQQKQPLVVATKHVLKRIENLDSMVEDLCKASPMKSYVFKQNIKLVEALNCCQSFGHIVAEIGSDVSASKTETTNDASEKFKQLDKGGAKVKKVKQKDTNTTVNVRQMENDGITSKHVRQIHTLSSTEERVQQLVNDGEKAERVRKIHTRGATSKNTRQMHILGITAENVRQTDNNGTTAENVKRLDIGGAKVEKVDYLGDINVKFPTDANDCWITGCVKIDEDRLAVADRNNRSVKVVNVKSAAIQSYVKLMYGPPWDITCIGGKELAVTCESTLLFLDTTTLNVKEIMNLDGCSRGIAYAQDKLLYITFVMPVPMIKIMNRTVAVLKTIVHENILDLTRPPLYITVTACGNTIVVTDNIQATVIDVLDCRNNLNLPVSSFGVAIDQNNNLLLADRSLCGLYAWRLQFAVNKMNLEPAKSLTRIGTILQYIELCASKHEIYVSYCSGSQNTNSLSVYKIIYVT